MNRSPSPMSRHVCIDLDPRSLLLALRSWEAQTARSAPPRRGTSARRPRSRATPCRRSRNRPSASKPPSHFATPASAANTTAPSGNVPNAATSDERVRRRELVGILHDVRNRRVLGRPPQQRQHLDRGTRCTTRPEERVEERQHREERGAPDVARDHHDLAVPPVDECTAERREQEARQHARDHHETDAGPRARDLRREREDRDEPDPVAEARRRPARRRAE